MAIARSLQVAFQYHGRPVLHDVDMLSSVLACLLSNIVLQSSATRSRTAAHVHRGIGLAGVWAQTGTILDVRVLGRLGLWFRIH